MDIDWNPAIHALDELSDGDYTLLELSYIAVSYDQKAFVDALLFLADRDLLELAEASGPLSKARCTERLREAFGVEVAEPAMLARTQIDLTSKGEDVLRLLNLGHPPLSF